MTTETQTTEPQTTEPAISKKGLRAPTRREVLGLSGASVVFLLGWFTEEGLAMAKDYFYPDQYQIQADAIRGELSRKTDEIKSLTDRMAEDLSGLRDGSADSAALEGFLAKAEQLMQRTEELQPAVTRASDVSAQLARADAASKATEIAHLGYSTRPDVTIREHEGFELCGERFFFGARNWRPTFDNAISADLAFREETQSDGSFHPGEILSIRGETTLATVAYSGVVGQGDDRRLAFNVACNPIPAS